MPEPVNSRLLTILMQTYLWDTKRKDTDPKVGVLKVSLASVDLVDARSVQLTNLPMRSHASIFTNRAPSETGEWGASRSVSNSERLPSLSLILVVQVTRW